MNLRYESRLSRAYAARGESVISARRQTRVGFAGFVIFAHVGVGVANNGKRRDVAGSKRKRLLRKERASVKRCSPMQTSDIVPKAASAEKSVESMSR